MAKFREPELVSSKSDAKGDLVKASRAWRVSTTGVPEYRVEAKDEAEAWVKYKELCGILDTVHPHSCVEVA